MSNVVAVVHHPNELHTVQEFPIPNNHAFLDSSAFLGQSLAPARLA